MLSLLHFCFQEPSGHDGPVAADTGPDVSEWVCPQVGQQQLRVPHQQLRQILSQALHAGVPHLLKVKNVFEEEKHLILAGEKKGELVFGYKKGKKVCHANSSFFNVFPKSIQLHIILVLRQMCAKTAFAKQFQA